VLQRAISYAPIVEVVNGSDVCGSKRLRKRVYGEASFTEASTVTGSLPVTVKRYRSLYLLKRALCKPLPSLHESCKLSPPRLGHVRIEEFDKRSRLAQAF
jgi:hypothetical protein